LRMASRSKKQAQQAPAQEALGIGADAPSDDVAVVPTPTGDREYPDLSKETLLPVSGMVRLSPREMDVINHPAFQRLFDIYQLGQTHLVYRGATHRRGEHAIGSVGAAMLIVDAIQRNCSREEVDPGEQWKPAARLSAEEIAFIRLGALLHDIGHLPAGHTLEDEIGLLPPHDGDKRIDLILARERWHGRDYPHLGGLIDELYEEDAERAKQSDPKGKALPASHLVRTLISKDHAGARSAPGSQFRVGVCRDVIGNTICADLIDYLHRDWLHIGKPRYFDSRLLEYMHILTRARTPDGDGGGKGGSEEKLVIHLGHKSRPRPDAVTAILDLLESRYQLSETVLFHRVKLAAAGMLERCLAEYRDSFPTAAEQRGAIEELTPDLLECSDAEMLKLFESKLQKRLEGAKGEKRKRIDAAADLTRRLRTRVLHRDLFTLYADETTGHHAKLIAHRFSGDHTLKGVDAVAESVRTAAENRLKAVRGIEGDFGLAPGSIVMYCPPLLMNTKIAEVGVYSNGLVASLAGLDEDFRISGGHLRAQQARFRRLWRVCFAIERGEYARLENERLLYPLRKLIESAVLWVQQEFDAEATQAIRDIAETLVRRDGSPWYQREVIEPALNREQAGFYYPGGAPSIRSCMSPKRSGDSALA